MVESLKLSYVNSVSILAIKNLYLYFYSINFVETANVSVVCVRKHVLLRLLCVTLLYYYMENSIIPVILFSLICFAGTLGNALVLYVFNVQRTANGKSEHGRQRTRTMDLLISYLAAIDLIGSIFSPLLYIYLHLTRYQHWAFGSFGCTFIFGVANMTTTMSFGIIVFITIERTIAICHPFKALTSSKRRIHLVIFLLFLISIGIDVPYLVNLKLTEIDSNHSITISSSHNNQTTYRCMTVSSDAYRTTRTVTFIVRSLCYIGIVSVANSYVYITIFKNSLITREKIKRRNQRTLKLMVMIGSVFIVLVLPKDLFIIVYNFSYGSASDNNINWNFAYKINEWLKVPQSMNSVCNVLIYAKLHFHFRREVKKRLESINNWFHGTKTKDKLFSVQQVNGYSAWV